MRASTCVISRSPARVSFASRTRDRNWGRLLSSKLILRSKRGRHSDVNGPPPPKPLFGFLTPPSNRGARLGTRRRFFCFLFRCAPAPVLGKGHSSEAEIRDAKAAATKEL